MQAVPEGSPDQAHRTTREPAATPLPPILSMTYGSRLVAAILIGTIAGVFLAVVHIVFHLLTGGIPAADGTMVSILAATAVDIGAGLVGGALAGLLQPLRTTLVGAAVIGMVSSIPLAAGTGLLYGSKFDQAGITSFLMITVLIGGGVGAYFGQGNRSGV